ncbi:TPR repeats containing protein [marine gamma proteobacterium HTCC2143]|uniref:TPR repeats containing protein n=1 Tax=marine gamma proteobacterium HTCC2143 TaxID=247633 RepID=A0YB50_9GAMM|nr:TPR repeats containing protein [marine gamma proteobacterium HTCC2143]
MKTLVKITGILTVALFTLTSGLANAGNDDSISTLQKRWAEVNYQLEGKEQITAFEQLIDKADSLVSQQPKNAPLLIWSGIIKSTYAGAKGGLGALKYAKAARTDLEKAQDIDPQALSGSAYTSLGTLYFNVPGWPIGFGDDKKAKKLLRKALTVNPHGIDPNYFFAQFLEDQGDLQEAYRYYEKALQAAPRPSRPVADKGRRDEIRSAMLKLKEKL